MTHLTNFLKYAAVTVMLTATLQPVCAKPSVGDLRAQYAQLSERYVQERPGGRPSFPSSGSLVFVAKDQYSSAGLNKYDDKLSRNTYADALFGLARQAAEAGQLSAAFQWATEAVRENPDHADARRVLGYEQRNGQWLTPYGVRMADAGKAWHPKFGWIVAAELPRYEAGERLVGTRWISAEEDAARRNDIKNGWQIRTDHFLVTTNHSLEAAAELAARLERLHQVWRQLFAGFYLTAKEVSGLFAGERQPRKQARPYRVYYHRDRDEYADALRRRQPRIADTLGIYFDANQEAHFFFGDEQDLATVYHEAVHQMFQECKPAARQIGRTANFWIIEAVATYFETLTEHADPVAGLYYTIGESTAGRFPAARARLADGFYVPLEELTRLGKNDFQHAELAKLYSQGAGLAALFMDGEQNRYREPLVRYLQAVYAGRDTADSLSEAFEASYEELDGQYRRFMKSLP